LAAFFAFYTAVVIWRMGRERPGESLEEIQAVCRMRVSR
jgi:hypothetical protein